MSRSTLMIVLAAALLVSAAAGPAAAELVVVVQGRCGPPWNGDPVANERLSWSSIKDLFH